MATFFLILLLFSFISMLHCIIGSFCSNNHRDVCDTYVVIGLMFMVIFIVSTPFFLYWHNIDNETRTCLYSSRYNEKKHCCDQIRYNDNDTKKYLFKDCKE